MSQPQLFTMPSGATLAVTVASFDASWALTKASLKTVKGIELKPEDLKLEMSDLMRSPAAITLIIDRVVDFATSPEVEAAFWRCTDHRVMYIPAGSPPEFPGEHLNKSLFDHPEHGDRARKDYAKIMASVLEVNCKPFLAEALSGFLKPKMVKSPENP